MIKALPYIVQRFQIHKKNLKISKKVIKLKYKKIIGILLVIGIAATFLGVVSAAEVEIDGMKINLPDGYKENATGSSEKMNGDTKTIVKRYYSADDTFTVNVITSNQGSISGLPHAQGGEVEKTISDVKGLYDEDKHHFTYVQNGKMVMLSGVDEADLKEILIK